MDREREPDFNDSLYSRGCPEQSCWAARSALGLTADASYANEEWQLHPGDRVLLYTDGIPEAQSPRGEFLDEHRVAEWLTAKDGANAAVLADSLLANVRRWRGAPSFDDDVTFVVVRVLD